MDSNRSEAERFLAALFGCYNEGHIEVRAIRGTAGKKAIQQDWFAVADVAEAAARALAASEAGWDAYVGVLPRKARSGRKTDVYGAGWVWCDLDFKEGEGAASLARLHGNAPTMLIASGGGVHCYWPLDRVTTFGGIQDARRFEQGLKRHAAQYDGDPAATDASRVLRVPGTLNYKYNPPRKVAFRDLPPVEDYGDPMGLTDAEQCAYWQGRLEAARTKCEQEYARIAVWLWNARAHGDKLAVARHEAEELAWRRRQARKRAGTRMWSHLVGAEIVVVEQIPFIPPGEPVIFERAELEKLQAMPPDVVADVWDLKREWGGKWEGDTLGGYQSR